MPDRLEDHNQDTGIVFAYPAKKDYQEKRFVPLSEIPESWMENPLFLVTNEETQRMSDLAQERIDFLRAGLNMPDCRVLVKVGLDVDPDRRDEAGTSTEHIWFRLVSIQHL